MSESIAYFILGILIGALLVFIFVEIIKAKNLKDKIRKAEKENDICRKNRLGNLISDIHSRTIRIDSVLKGIELFQESTICKTKKR